MNQADNPPWGQHPGPILLLAGPGTGKTHQLALRTKDLVEKRGVNPEHITIITFTKEAAENMRRRISDEDKREVYIAPELRPHRIVTMHSLGLEIVRSFCASLGLPDDFEIMTNSRLRRILFHDAALLCGYDEPEAREADSLRQQSSVPALGSPSQLIVNKYEAILRGNNSIDYDDQISLACKVLEGNGEAKSRYRTFAEHLLIDEYQDINAGQRELIGHLSGLGAEGLFVVGDDDQSIYSFRGGTPRYVRQFLGEHGESARLASLILSRRCPGRILNAALRVVEAHDTLRLLKPGPTFLDGRGEDGVILVHDVPTDAKEADVIGKIVQAALPKKDVLILVPARQYAESVKREFRRRRIGYDHPPSLDDSGFLLLQTIHDWCGNAADSCALRMCIEALCESGVVGVPSSRTKKLENLRLRREALLRIATLWEDVISRRMTLWEVLESKARSEDGLLRTIYQTLAQMKEVDPKNPDEFLARVTKNLRPWTTVSELMREVSAWLEELRSRGQGAQGRVRIMTLQGAKGLEADIVCVVGLNERILPRGGGSEEAIRESARLAYVSMTRAKEELHLFHARTRDASITYLKDSFQLKPSRFLTDLVKDKKNTRYYAAPSKKSR